MIFCFLLQSYNMFSGSYYYHFYCTSNMQPEDALKGLRHAANTIKKIIITSKNVLRVYDWGGNTKMV